MRAPHRLELVDSEEAALRAQLAKLTADNLELTQARLVNRLTECTLVNRLTECTLVNRLTECRLVNRLTECMLAARSSYTNARAPLPASLFYPTFQNWIVAPAGAAFTDNVNCGACPRRPVSGPRADHTR